MKKISLLLLGILIAIASVSQPETLHIHGSPIAEPALLLLKFKWNKVIDESIFTGHDAVYQPESDQGSNTQGTKIRILAAHIAGNAEITAGDIALLEAFVAELVKPGTYVPPTGGPGPTPIVLREHVNDQGSTIVYDPGWQKIPANPATQWLDKFFQKDATLITAPGVWASYPFRGRKIELIGEKCDNHGTARIEIVKGTTVVESKVVDMYQSTGTAANPATATNWCPAGVVTALFTSADLPLDNYVIRWKFESADLTKVPRRDSMVIDGVKVYE